MRLDYEDFLRQRGLPIWDHNDPRRQALVDRRCTTADEVAAWIRQEHDRGRVGLSGPVRQDLPASSAKAAPSTFPELAANAALVLLAVACSLLDCQLAAQAKAFETEGGFTERLYRMRSEKRLPSPPCPPSPPLPPTTEETDARH